MRGLYTRLVPLRTPRGTHIRRPPGWPRRPGAFGLGREGRCEAILTSLNLTRPGLAREADEFFAAAGTRKERSESPEDLRAQLSFAGWLRSERQQSVLRRRSC
jgi:hypothetical protein